MCLETKHNYRTIKEKSLNHHGYLARNLYPYIRLIPLYRYTNTLYVFDTPESVVGPLYYGCTCVNLLFNTLNCSPVCSIIPWFSIMQNIRVVEPIPVNHFSKPRLGAIFAPLKSGINSLFLTQSLAAGKTFVGGTKTY